MAQVLTWNKERSLSFTRYTGMNIDFAFLTLGNLPPFVNPSFDMQRKRL